MQILSILKVVKGIISRVYSVHHLVYSHLPHLWNGNHKRPKLTSFVAIKGIKCVIYLEISKVYKEACVCVCVCVCVSCSVVSNSLQPHRLQPARQEYWSGLPFPSPYKGMKYVKHSKLMLSHMWLFVTLWTTAHQAPLSMGFPCKNTRVGCHFLLQEIFLT